MLPRYAAPQLPYGYSSNPQYYYTNNGVIPPSNSTASAYPQTYYAYPQPDQPDKQPDSNQQPSEPQQLVEAPQPGSPEQPRSPPQEPAQLRTPEQQFVAPQQSQAHTFIPGNTQYSPGFNPYLNAPMSYANASYTSPRQPPQQHPLQHSLSASVSAQGSAPLPTYSSDAQGVNLAGERGSVNVNMEQLGSSALKEQNEFNAGYDYRRNFPGRKSQGYFGRGTYSVHAGASAISGNPGPTSGSGGAAGSGANGVTKPHISVFETKASRPRRRMSKTVAEVKYPQNYPAHEVPDEMRVPTSLPGGATVMPPLLKDITSKRYATGVDDRNFLTVLEYEVNGQSIIWDYYTGYVHLTGLWKAVGHSKADIVRLLDYSPELEPLIKRVRGGFLKIQGTWVPYDIARRLASRVCYYIRFALIPIFGASFPSDCMQPDTPGFGMLQMYYPSNAFTSRTGMTSLAAIGATTPTPKAKPEIDSHDNVPEPSALPHTPLQAGEETPKSAHPLPLFLPSHAQPYPLQHSAEQYSVPQRSAPQYSAPQLSAPQLSAPHLSVLKTETTNVVKENTVVADLPLSPPKSHTSSIASIDAPTLRPRVNSTLGASVPFRERQISEESVFEDDDADANHFTPPPITRTVSFPEQSGNNASEILAMLNATRSLQQLSAGKYNKVAGGNFEPTGKQTADPAGSVDGKCHTPPTVPSPELKKATLTRRPTLTTILNS